LRADLRSRNQGDHGGDDGEPDEDLGEVTDERDDSADLHRSVVDQHCACCDHGCGTEVGDEDDAREQHRRQRADAVSCRGQGGVGCVETGGFEVLSAECTDDFDARQLFAQNLSDPIDHRL
jgi:hypothetical protein